MSLCAVVHPSPCWLRKSPRNQRLGELPCLTFRGRRRLLAFLFVEGPAHVWAQGSQAASQDSAVGTVSGPTDCRPRNVSAAALYSAVLFPARISSELFLVKNIDVEVLFKTTGILVPSANWIEPVMMMLSPTSVWPYNPSNVRFIVSQQRIKRDNLSDSGHVAPGPVMRKKIEGFKSGPGYPRLRTQHLRDHVLLQKHAINDAPSSDLPGDHPHNILGVELLFIHPVVLEGIIHTHHGHRSPNFIMIPGPYGLPRPAPQATLRKF